MASSGGFQYGDPGFTGSLETVERNIYWGSDPTKKIERQTITITSGATDSTNTPTTLLRAGLALGKITATGFYTAYSPTATDGSQFAEGVLEVEVNMLDPYTGAVATRVNNLVISGPVKAGAVANLDYVSRKQLSASGIIFDDNRTAGFGVPFLKTVSKAADYTVTAADNGTLFLATTGAVNFTLPTLAAGLHFIFYNTVDAAMAILSAGSADDIITDGDLAADSVTFSTANHKIGGAVMFVANDAGTKWLTFFMGAAPANVVTVA